MKKILILANIIHPVMQIAHMLFMLIILIILNGYSLLLFRGDKKRAERNEWRTSENKLLFTAFLGPFGAYYGMSRYRHKTKKLKFKLVPLFAIAQIVLILFLLMYF